MLIPSFSLNNINVLSNSFRAGEASIHVGVEMINDPNRDYKNQFQGEAERK